MSLNRKVAAVLVPGVIVLAVVAGRYSERSTPSAKSREKRILYYVDPMHPSYRSDRPGTAPDCGMALEPVYEGENNSAKTELPAGAVAISPERQQLYGIRVETIK